MSNQLTGYLEEHSLLTNDQFCFRAKISSEKALHSLIDYLYSNIDQGNCVVGLYLDQTQTFDSNNRQILLSKLLHYGSGGANHDWFSNYKSDRRQYPFVNGFKST